MKRTKRNATLPRVTVEEALQILQSAIGYCQLAGLTVQGANTDTGLTLAIPGVFCTTGSVDSGTAFRMGPSTSQSSQVVGKDVKKAILYARSATSQGDEAARQIEKCRAWAMEHGYHVSGQYVDGGSGNNPHLPMRARAIARATADKAVLVCVQPDRLARDNELLAQILADCKRSGLTVYFVEGDKT